MAERSTDNIKPAGSSAGSVTRSGTDGSSARLSVSVVMAAYNGERYIEEQLRSILRQTRVPDEIIIRDDGSSDRTAEVVERVKCSDPHGSIIDYAANASRLGFADNFFSAVREAHGDIIFFCDQDDAWYPHKVERMLEVFETDGRVLALSSDYDIAEEIPEGAAEVSKGALTKISFSDFIRHPKYPGMAMAVRKGLAEEAAERFFESGTAHDWAVNYLACDRNGLFFLDEKLGFYRQHAANTLGMLQYKIREERADARVRMIMSIVRDMEGAADSRLQQKIDFDRKRAELLKEKKGLALLIFDLFHPGLISLRSALGDIYPLIK